MNTKDLLLGSASSKTVPGKQFCFACLSKLLWSEPSLNALATVGQTIRAVGYGMYRARIWAKRRYHDQTLSHAKDINSRSLAFHPDISP